jgi:hypothetical protein
VKIYLSLKLRENRRRGAHLVAAERIIIVHTRDSQLSALDPRSQLFTSRFLLFEFYLTPPRLLEFVKKSSPLSILRTLRDYPLTVAHLCDYLDTFKDTKALEFLSVFGEAFAGVTIKQMYEEVAIM